jgi:serine/threonine protein kinase
MGIRSFMHPCDGLSGFEPRTADAGSGGSGVSGLRLLPSPLPLDCYELRGVIAEGAAAIVYLGTDLTLRVPVAIREYMPQGLAWRDATSRVLPLSPAQEIPFARGLQAFIDEARTLARCDHPSLLRIVRLLEANGTAYSVMPHYVGRRLTDVGVTRRRLTRTATAHAPAELLGALRPLHAFGSVHGGVSPDNILLLQNGRPVPLLTARPKSRDVGRADGHTDRVAMNHRSGGSHPGRQRNRAMDGPS